MSLYNSVLVGWPRGIVIDATTGTPTDLNINTNSLRIMNTTLAGNTVNTFYRPSTTAPTGATDASIFAWFTTASYNNTIVTNSSEAKLIQPFNYSAVDPTPFAGSNGYAPIVSGAAFTDSYLTDPFFTVTTYRGAIAPAGTESTWWKGWTRFN